MGLHFIRHEWQGERRVMKKKDFEISLFFGLIKIKKSSQRRAEKK